MLVGNLTDGSGKAAMHIRTTVGDGVVRDGNRDLRRIFPWDGVVATPWESAMVSIHPQESSTEQSSGVEQTFIFTHGSGMVTMGSEKQAVQEGDVVYVPRGGGPVVVNTSDREPLSFVSIRWVQDAWA